MKQVTDFPIARNRHERRALQAQTVKAFKNPSWGEWEHRFGLHNPSPKTDICNGWCNNKFAVLQYRCPYWDRIMVRKHDSSRVEWVELQRIKNELFGENRVAIQVLPRQVDLVDSANMYWFFLVPTNQEEFIDTVTNNQGKGTP